MSLRELPHAMVINKVLKYKNDINESEGIGSRKSTLVEIEQKSHEKTNAKNKSIARSNTVLAIALKLSTANLRRMCLFIVCALVISEILNDATMTVKRSQRIISIDGTTSGIHSNFSTELKTVFERTDYELDDEHAELDKERSNRLPVNSSACTPMKKWHEMAKPTCNTMHEIDFKRDIGQRIGTGGHRMAWKLEDENIIFKTVFRSSFTAYHHEAHTKDAIISEQLSASPHAISIYGYCAQSVLNEQGITGFGDYYKKHDHDGKSLPPSRLIVRYALEMASALVDLHYMSSGTDRNVEIVHKDLKKNHYLITRDGSLKLSDFAGGEFLQWNRTNRC